MSSVSFSLTEKIIIDPILNLRAPLESSQKSWTTTVTQIFQSEVIARILAVFTSIFAAADALIHFAAGIYKGSCLSGRSHHKPDACAHFQKAAWFAGLAMIGSIAAVVWPGIFKYCYSSSEINQGNIRLLEGDAGKEIRVPIGKPFSIKLWHSITTGHHSWRISQTPSFMNYSGQLIERRNHTPGICGGGDDYIFVFNPKEPGRGNIVMRKTDFGNNPSRTEEKKFTIIAE